jgi:1-deoxy-D-xylulose-5-phosphate reductoisomerase
MSGVKPTISCLKSCFDVAFANKETLVAKGRYINKLIGKKKSKLIPIDSEISSLYQLKKYILEFKQEETILKYGITASGGSLRDKTNQDLINTTKDEVLNHPNWKMGKKITIDSATLLNKAFEVIECIQYFNINLEDVEVLQERTSHVHAFIKTNVCTYYFISQPDMKDNILYAISDSRVDSTKIFTNNDNHPLTQLSLNKYPLFTHCLTIYKKNPNLMSKYINVSQHAANLFINDKIIYVELIKYMLNKVR